LSPTQTLTPTGSSSSNGAVRYNDAHDIHSENAAIYCYDATDIDIIGNLVYNVPNNDGIKLGDSGDGSTGGLVTHNEVHDIAEDGITIYASGVTVENNTIYNCGSENGALYLYGADGTPVRKNKIYDNAAIGLLIRNSDNVTVEENEIYNNDDSDDTKYVGSAGIWLTPDASNVLIHTNCIAGNAEFGINNESADIVDAEGNWWGDPSGPHHPTANPAGAGDAVSDNVDFDPWLQDGCPLITGSIHVEKYLDEDENGDRGPAEPGLEGWEFTLTDAQGTPVAQGLTDEDGNLSFTDLPLGVYEVCEILQEGWVNSDPGDTCQTVILGSGSATPGPESANLTTDDGDSFLIQFLGTTNGGLTWNYRVTEVLGKDLSHWVLGLCMSQDAVTGWDPVEDDDGIKEVELVDPDPTTGVSGIKWGVDDDFNDDGYAGGDSREFSFTLDTVYPIGTTEVAIKTGGADKTADSSIAGPHCGDGPSEVTLVFGNYEEDNTAVTLASFTARAGVGAVKLEWETGTEVDNAGFNLYRATAPGGPFTKVNAALIAAEGDPVAGASYSFLDQRLLPATYYYKLEDIDFNGMTTLHGPVSATVLPRFRRPAYRPTLPGF
jgi:parallel beta-helix repeat protein